MNDNKVSEVTKTPRFILVLFFIQLFVFIFFLNKENKMDLEIFYILIPVTLLLTLSFLKVVFKKDNLEYQLFPIHIKPQKAYWNEMENIKIVKIDAISDFLGWGLRYSRKYGWGYILGNDNAVFITFKNGKKITFTIKNKENIISFLKDNNIPFNQ